MHGESTGAPGPGPRWVVREWTAQRDSPWSLLLDLAWTRQLHGASWFYGDAPVVLGPGGEFTRRLVRQAPKSTASETRGCKPQSTGDWLRGELARIDCGGAVAELRAAFDSGWERGEVPHREGLQLWQQLDALTLGREADRVARRMFEADPDRAFPATELLALELWERDLAFQTNNLEWPGEWSPQTYAWFDEVFRRPYRELLTVAAHAETRARIAQQLTQWEPARLFAN